MIKYRIVVCRYSKVLVNVAVYVIVQLIIHSAFRKSLCTYKRYCKSIERTVVNKNQIKQLHTLPVLRFNRCLTTEYSEITAHFNGNFDTDNQIYVP
jgi:hypothetical protein